MTKREELETALAQSEAAREYLEAALATAKAALVNTVTDTSKIDATRDDASAKVDRARARCRELRAALLKSGHSKTETRSHERIAIFEKQSDELSKRQVAASPPSMQQHAHRLRGESKKSQDEPQQRKLVLRLSDVLEWSLHAREAIGLLALVLAYLQYYYFDVQLQIVSLPSVIALLLR